MKNTKRFISLLLSLLLLMGAVAVGATTAFADNNPVSVYVTPDKAEAHPGDEISYTLKIGPVENLAGAEIKLVIPEGLTFISARLADNIKETLNIDEIADISFTESSKKLLFFGGDYSSTDDTVLMTFRCSVDDDAENEKTVTLSTCLFSNLDAEQIPANTDNLNSTVYISAAPVEPTGVSLDKHEINFTEGDSPQTLTATIAPAGATGTITWYSNNPSVAEVSGNNDGTATVSAAGVGTATITATIQGTDYTDTCAVNVGEYVCPHTNKTETPEKGATCTEDGNNKYYYCNDCGKYLKADGTTETTPDAESIPNLGGHSFGNNYESNESQHWQICDRCYEATARENHTFGGASYDWSADNSTCTAKHTCTVCGKEVSETVNSTPREIPATCYDSPKTVYTATFTKEGFSTQTEEMSYGEPAGHDWGEPTYTWSGDNSTCTATRVCTKDASHKEEETVTAAVTTTATCTEAGTATYTATFANAAFEVQVREVAVDARGHDWSEEEILQAATADSLGEARKKCSRCGEVEYDTYPVLADDTNPAKYADGTNISEGDTMQADSSQKLGDTDVMVIVQDPLYAAELYSVVIESISEDLGDDYDGAYTAENAYKANVIIINDSGVQISGQLRGKVRLLLEIPDGWDVNEVQVLRLTEGNDIEFVEGIEYQLYDAQGNFIKVVDKDYQPAEGETVKAFAVVWTDHFSPYALVDPLENTDKEYNIKFVNEDGTELQSTKVLYGETPEYKGETPVKAATDKATYTFKGWSPEIVPVTGDATYTATFTETKKDKPAAKAAIAIKGEDALTLGYKQNKTFTADTEGVPEGGKVQWYLNGEKAGEGKTFKVENPEDDYTVQSKIVDASGSTVAESETVKVTVKHGFLDKLKAWFTDLILGVFAPLFSKFESVC